MNNILKGLNDEQLKAATSIDGAYRLIAGAGSGKTFTLTRRVAYICETKGITPDRVLSLTFTNKAAEEMADRLSTLMGVSKDSIYMSTYHHFAYDILKRDYQKIFGWSNLEISQTSAGMLTARWVRDNNDLFSMLDSNIRESLIKYLTHKVSSALSKDYYVEWLDKSYGRVPLATTKEVLDYMQKEDISKKAYESYKRVIKGDKSKPVPTPDKIKAAALKLESSRIQYVEGEVSPIGTWVRGVIQSKTGLVTFDDIIKMGIYMLEKYPDILEYWQNRFDYIQGDEFQDTDFKQLKMLQLLYAKHGNLFVVGDPDQSIYLFRGAEPTVLTNLGEYIPNLKTIFMRKNYRSTPEIVKISDKVIELNKNRIKKTCESQTDRGSNIKIIHGSTVDIASKEVAIIEQLIKNGVDLKNIAVLYSNKGDDSTKQLQDMLGLKGIKFNTTLKNERTYRDATLALCKYKHSENEKFMFDAMAIIDDTGEKVFDIKTFETIELTEKDLFSCYEKSERTYKKDGKPTASYDRFLKAEVYIRDEINEALEYWSLLSIEERDSLCVEDTKQVLGGIQPEEGDGINIMTIHRSKGLEYEYVFINGLDSETFNSRTDTGLNIEEKARLAYVGYSRAKSVLYISIDSATTMHGVIGQIVNENYLDFDSSNTASLVRGLGPIAVKEFENTIDNKIGVKYQKLVKDDKTVGYRCSYYINGEKLAYHAKIEDLQRLNCEPKEYILLVFIGDDIKVLGEDKGHLYTFDEMTKLVKVIDLTTDEEIKEVFGGSNIPYTKDIKNKDNMSKIYENKKDETDNRVDNFKRSQAIKNNDINHREEDIKKEKKTDTTRLIRVISKESKQVLGIRICKGDKFRDLSLQDAANNNITPDMCKETLEISTEKKLKYSDVYTYNSMNKSLNTHIRIIEVEFKSEICSIMMVSTKQYAKISIKDLIKNIENKKCFVTNLSKIQGWKNFI